MPQPKMPPVLYDLIQLQGGLDLVTPTLLLPAGVARDALNFEVSITGGYSRILGYERYDGRPSPSAATYKVMTVTFLAAVAVGATITGATSGATGVVIAVTSTELVFTKATGTFSPGETVRVGGVAKATVVALGGSITSNGALSARYTYLASQNYRNDITAVPGSGAIRGVAYFNSQVYAWRDAEDGLSAAIYKDSGSGWTLVPLGYQLSYDTGSVAINEDDVIVGGTSAAEATVKRVTVESGSVGAGTAAGRLIFASVTGTFQAGEDLKVGGVKVAEAVDGEEEITLEPGGRVETVIATFGASTYLYGVDGVNPAFEFDGTVYTPIHTGTSPDTPTHIAAHKQHLFLSYGSSVQFSALSNPFNWEVANDAGEFVMTEDVTAFQVQPGDQSTGAMAIYSDDNTSVLYGTGTSTFNLVSFNVGTGAKAYSTQNIGASYSFDDRGVISMATTLNYGNFDSAALTLNLRPFIQVRRNLVTASGVSREKNQYRVFFSDGYGLYVTLFNGKYMGAMPVQFLHPVACMCEGEQPDGSETSFFGSTNGYVYRLDAGTSFDGGEISANLLLVFNAQSNSRILKRYRRGSLEISGTGYAEFTFSYNLGYSTVLLGQDPGAQYTSDLQASYWDQFTWDNFVWDGRTLAPSEVDMTGTAENVAVRFACLSALYPSFTINSVILHYTPRRGLR